MRITNLNDLPEVLTIEEVAYVLQVTPLTLKRWEKRGQIKAIRINTRGDRRYHKDEIYRVLGMKGSEQSVY